MKKFIQIIIISILYFTVTQLYSQNKLYQEYSGEASGNYQTRLNFEEATMLKPPFPALIDTLYVYLEGNKECQDTIWVTQDPTDGLRPPTLFVFDYATYGRFIFDFKESGWYKFDLTHLGLIAGGYNRIGVLHHINKDCPTFVFDNKSQGNKFANINSWLCDVYKPNPNFYNIAGTLTNPAAGKFLVKLSVRYLLNEKPEPTMLDVTEKIGLIDDHKQLIKYPIVTVVDWNNDGFDDIATGNHFFKNNGDATFTEVTTTIGIKGAQTIWGDIDNDGYIDCFSVGGGLNDLIFYGSADGTFSEETDKTVKLDQPTITPLLFDYDKDGLLDIYIAYGRRSKDGKETYYPDQLFHNLGNRKFENVTTLSGVSKAEKAPYYDCWGASVCDYNNDGWIDIFVATYRLAPDMLFRNNGDGTFTDIGAESGARGVKTQSPQYFGHGMGSDWGDYDNDGDYDLIVGNLGHPDSRGAVSNPSLLLQNQGNPNFNFENITSDSRLLFFEMNGGIVWADLNNDTYLDIVHSEYSYTKKDEYPVPNHARFYLNSGQKNNFRMVDKTWELGADIHGSWCPVRLDYDNDGDMDIIVASSNENLKLFENQLPNKGNWSEIKLVGDMESGINSLAYGAEVKLYMNGKKYIRNLPGSISNGRASQSTNIIHFGLGDNAKIDSIIVNWNNANNALTKIITPPANLILKIGIGGIINLPKQGILSFDKSVIDFGILDVGQEKTQEFIIKNTGKNTINISKIELIGNEKEVFNIDSYAEMIEIAPNDSKIINITFKPTQKNTFQAYLQINNDAINSSLGKIKLMGIGYEPSGEIQLLSQLIDFDSVLVEDSKTMKIAIKNIGEADLNINDAKLLSENNQFFTIENNLPMRIAVNETANLELTFEPTIEKQIIDDLHIYSDAFINSKINIQIKAFGESRKAFIASDFEKIEFDTIELGSVATQKFKIMNTGNKQLEISSIIVKLDKKEEFEILDLDLPYSIPPNNGISLTAQYTPKRVGRASKTMEITSDASNLQKFYISLRGVGKEGTYINESFNNNNQLELKIYPNSIIDNAVLDINLKNNISKPLIFKIMDTNGKYIKEIPTTICESGGFSINLNLSNLSSGYYFLTNNINNSHIPIIISK